MHAPSHQLNQNPWHVNPAKQSQQVIPHRPRRLHCLQKKNGPMIVVSMIPAHAITFCAPISLYCPTQFGFSRAQ